MTWQPQQKEIESVLNLSAADRYRYFIRRAADAGFIYGLWADTGWVLAEDDRGHELFPIWPHSRYAEICVGNNWAASQPREIDLDTWLERWLPGLERDGRLVGVFPTPDDRGIVVEASRVTKDLNEELKNYE